MEGAPAGTLADQGITPAELRLAARNHGLPLEALRHPITPAGLHYLLIHYDIPAVDPEGFQLVIGGAVERTAEPLPRRASGTAARGAADHLRVRRQRPGAAGAAPAQPAVAHGGGGHGGVGRHATRAAARGGGPEGHGDRASLQRPRPRHRGRRAAGLRARAPDRRGRRGAARVRDERRPAPAPARLPAAAGGARLVRDAEREVAVGDHRPRGAVRRLPERGGVPDVRRGRRAGRAGHAHAAALADGPARRAGLHDEDPLRRARPDHPDRPRLVRLRRHRAGRGLNRRRHHLRCRSSRTAAGPQRLARLELHLGRHARRPRALSSRATDAAGNSQPLEPPWNLKGYANNAVERITVVVGQTPAAP